MGYEALGTFKDQLSKVTRRSPISWNSMGEPVKFAGSRASLPKSSLPKISPLDFATKNTFPLFFAGEEALVGIY